MKTHHRLLYYLSALLLLSGFGLLPATGNLCQMSEQYAGQATARTVTNTYDAAVRLDTEQITEADGTSTLSNYDYDAAGNRTKLTKTTGAAEVVHEYSHNVLNQLTGFTKTGAEDVSYTYDAKGNRATRTQGTQTDTYVWDAENRLKQIDHAATAKTYRYGYDHRTRRVIRQEGTQTTLVQHSGGTSLAEWTLPAGTVLPTVYGGAGSIGTATQSKVFIRGSDMGGGVGGLLYSEQAQGTSKPTVTISSNGSTWTKTNISNLVLAPSLNHYNGRGDVVAKTDASGSVTWTGSYEAFGTRTRETGTNDDRQRANTKDEDPTGLLNEGFRYRDLETGTWLSRDPAGFVDGPNLYAYVRANPWSKFDAQGLFEIYPLQPIHEIITVKALANANGISNQAGMNAARGVDAKFGRAIDSLAWNVANPDSGQLSRSSLGRGAHAMAAGGGLIGAVLAERGPQIAALHYGSEQWKHSMASNEKTAEELTSKIKRNLNAQFDTALKCMAEGKEDVAYATLAEISHTIQDSYSESHVERNVKTGAIKGFNSYPDQASKKHAVADRVDGAKFPVNDSIKRYVPSIDDYDKISNKPGVGQATDDTTNVITAFMNGDRDSFNAQLDKTYETEPGARVGGSGGYGKSDETSDEPKDGPK